LRKGTGERRNAPKEITPDNLHARAPRVEKEGSNGAESRKRYLRHKRGRPDLGRREGGFVSDFWKPHLG